MCNILYFVQLLLHCSIFSLSLAALVLCTKSFGRKLCLCSRIRLFMFLVCLVSMLLDNPFVIYFSRVCVNRTFYGDVERSRGNILYTYPAV